jgi:hypothetical protein
MTYYRDKRFDKVLLEPDQIEIFELMAEAARSLPKDRRQKFHLLGVASSHLHVLVHDAISPDHPGVFEGDIEALADAGMLSRSSVGGHAAYDITPFGYQYFEFLKTTKGAPIERIAREVRSYLDADRFRARYPIAIKKIAEAEALLWSADADAKQTTICLLCREALQEFVDVVIRHGNAGADIDKARTMARLKAVVASRQPSAAIRDYLDSLIGLVGAVSDLAQRQEHGGAKEGEPIVWTDGRRLIFATLFALSECDRSLGPSDT